MAMPARAARASFGVRTFSRFAHAAGFPDANAAVKAGRFTWYLNGPYLRTTDGHYSGPAYGWDLSQQQWQ